MKTLHLIEEIKETEFSLFELKELKAIIELKEKAWEDRW